jgi:hypothetical protein
VKTANETFARALANTQHSMQLIVKGRSYTFIMFLQYIVGLLKVFQVTTLMCSHEGKGLNGKNKKNLNTDTGI